MTFFVCIYNSISIFNNFYDLQQFYVHIVKATTVMFLGNQLRVLLREKKTDMAQSTTFNKENDIQYGKIIKTNLSASNRSIRTCHIRGRHPYFINALNHSYWKVYNSGKFNSVKCPKTNYWCQQSFNIYPTIMRYCRKISVLNAWK